ncbi:MAG: efflux RND transporter permease subunit, partial [Bacillota bacterium]|nr:efflux RND transporter permease subunit [Bacillota bacterium]
AYQLADALSAALSGTSTTNLKMDGEEIAVNLSLSDDYNASVDNMRQILIPTAYGTTVPVGQVATLVFDNSPTQIDRSDQQRYVTVDVTVEGNDLSAVSQDILAFMDQYPFPDGYRYEEGGTYEQMIEAFEDLFLALLAAVLLVFIVMAAQFESLLMSIIVMLSVPFAVSGAFLLLFLTGNTLSLTSFTGLIILVGIVVNNAILLVEFIKFNKQTMERDEAIVLAGKFRLRPILMTTLTTCVGMIPLSLGRGDGGEILAPLAISVMGGLVGSTLVTLILIPVFYASIDDARLRREEKKAERQRRIAALEQRWKEEDEARGKQQI